MATSRGDPPHVTVEHPAHQSQRDGLHGRADEQERPPPGLVHQGDGHAGEEQVHQPDPHRGGEGGIVHRSRRREDPRGVVDDRVDPAELRARHQQHGDHERTAIGSREELARTGPPPAWRRAGSTSSSRSAWSGPSTFSKTDLASSSRPCWASQRGLSGTVNSSPSKTMAGTASSPEHPPPAVSRVPGLVAQALDHLVDEQREEDAGDDPELKERAQPPSRPSPARSRRCRRDRSSTTRRCPARSGTARPGIARRSGAGRRESPRPRTAAAQRKSIFLRPNRSARNPAHIAPGMQPRIALAPAVPSWVGVQAHVRLEIGDGPVDHGRVIAEEEAADRRHGRRHDDVFDERGSGTVHGLTRIDGCRSSGQDHRSADSPDTS